MRGECGFVWPTAGPCIYSRKEHDDYQLGHDFEEKKLQQTEWDRDPKENPSP